MVAIGIHNIWKKKSLVEKQELYKLYFVKHMFVKQAKRSQIFNF
jgi:hypothetical protein